jgi:GPH family glycoside/pentoside/hexuronide:cation symporter
MRAQAAATTDPETPEATATAMATAADAEAAGAARAGLPTVPRLLYASAAFGAEALGRSRDLWLLFFYAPPADSGRSQLLPLATVALLLAVLRVTDALDEFLVGWWSDRFRSRWGRRIPFVLVGAPLWALAAVAVVMPPAGGTTVQIAVWFFVASQLFGIFTTVAGAPYDALLPEIAPTDGERVKVMTARVGFALGGATVGLVASGLLVERFGVPGMMIAAAALALTTRYLGLAGVWRHVDRNAEPSTLPLLDSLKATVANRHFRAFLPSFVLFQTALALLLAALPFYVAALLGGGAPGDGTAGAAAGGGSVGVWVSVLSGVAVLAVVAAMVPFGRLAARRSKRAAYARAMLLTAVAFPLLAFAGWLPLPGVPPLVQAAVAVALVGAPLAGVFLFPAVLVADIAEDEAARTGHRREATFFGAQGFVEKTTGALAPPLLAGLLMLGSTAANPLGLRLLGPAAGALVLLGWWLFRGYALDGESASRRVGESARGRVEEARGRGVEKKKGQGGGEDGG